MGRVADLFREQSITIDGQTKQKMLALDREFVELESKMKILDAENLKLRAEVNPLKKEIERLKQQGQQSSPPVNMNPRGYHCDDCNSTKLKRTRSTTHQHFGEMGVKNAFFTCLDCGKESVFMEDPNK